MAEHGNDGPKLVMSVWERRGYVAAVLILILGGALVRTFILNWLVGPAVVVVAVWVAVSIGDRREASA